MPGMNSNMALHFKYWIGILLAVIVLVAAAAWGADPKLVDKVNFAVGITSVILALLAIYVTMAFSTLFSNNVVTFLGLNNRIEESATKLIAATTDLNTKLDIIPTGFKEVSDAVQTSSERLLKTLTAQKPSSATSLSEPRTETFPYNLTADDLAFFYPSMQYLAIVSTYLAVHAHRRSRIISHEDLKRINLALDSGYFIAVMGFLTSLRLCRFELGQLTFTITYVNPILGDNVDTWITTIITWAREGRMSGQPAIIESGKVAVDILLAESPPPAPAAPSSPAPAAPPATS